MTTGASGLAFPWSLAFLPDSRMLLTEKPGRLRLISADGRVVSPPIAGVPSDDAQGQGGLADVLPAAEFASTRRIFLSHATSGTGGEAGRKGLAVGRSPLSADGTALTQWQVIFRQTPKVVSAAHFGGCLVLAPEGLLFITTAERQRNSERGKSQDPAQGHDKIVRIREDGSVLADNPFVGKPGAQPTIRSCGHRSVQGAAPHPLTGELWAMEHGPQGGDELNRVLPGRNDGWPLVSFGCEYGAPLGNCPRVGGATAGPGFEAPLTTRVPTSIAPSGLAF